MNRRGPRWLVAVGAATLFLLVSAAILAEMAAEAHEAQAVKSAQERERVRRAIEAEAGAEPPFDLGVLVRAVVVGNQMQIDLGRGLLIDCLEKRQLSFVRRHTSRLADRSRQALYLRSTGHVRDIRRDAGPPVPTPPT
jgi:hypothetical protein